MGQTSVRYVYLLNEKSLEFPGWKGGIYELSTIYSVPFWHCTLIPFYFKINSSSHEVEPLPHCFCRCSSVLGHCPIVLSCRGGQHGVLARRHDRVPPQVGHVAQDGAREPADPARQHGGAAVHEAAGRARPRQDTRHPQGHGGHPRRHGSGMWSVRASSLV